LSFHISVCVLNFAGDRRKFESDFQKANPFGDALSGVFFVRPAFRGHPREINSCKHCCLRDDQNIQRSKMVNSFFKKSLRFFLQQRQPPIGALAKPDFIRLSRRQ